MTRAEIIGSFEKRHKHWRCREVDGLVGAYAADAVVDSPIFGELRGRADIEASFRELLKVFHGWTFDDDELVIDGDKTAQLFHMQGMHSQPFFGVPPSGRPFAVQGVMLIEFERDLIVRERRLYDISDMLIQLGVLNKGA